MKDLDPEWFSEPITGRHIFNLALESARLSIVGFEGSYCIIRSTHPSLSLNQRNQEDLKELVRRFIAAGVELGEQLRHHSDFKLI